MHNQKTLFVTSMRLGDTLYVLPVLSWFVKHFNVKSVDWAVCSSTPYRNGLVSILEKQNIVGKILEFDYNQLTPYKGKFGCHRPYDNIKAELHEHFHTENYQQIYTFAYDKDKYINQSIRFFSEHFGEPYAFGVDYNYKLNYGEPDYTYKNDVVKVDKIYNPLLKDIDAVELDYNRSMFDNLRLCAGAKDVITTRTGMVVALTLARIPFKIKFFENDYDWYYSLCHTINGGVERI